MPAAPVPVTPALLPGLLAGLIAGRGAGRLSVAVDGAPAAAPAAFADTLLEPLRTLGRPAVRVSGEDYLRPASVRLEHGRFDLGSYRYGWLDVAALQREALGPFARDGRYLPALRDPSRDRATRAAPQQAPAGGVLIVNGTFLRDDRLHFDVFVHLRLGAAALRRRTPDDRAWTLPAYAGYNGESGADVVVRLDDPAHPAVLVRASS